MHLRSRLASVVAIVLTFTVLATVAFAHNVVWYVPGVGPSYWGFGCHDDNQFPAPGQPNDYHFCGGVLVSQAAAGSIDWSAIKVTQGVEYNPPAYYGNAYIYDGSGQIVRTITALACFRVNSGDLADYFSQHTVGSIGTYQQQSGAGDQWCYGSYVANDYLQVVGY